MQNVRIFEEFRVNIQLKRSVVNPYSMATSIELRNNVLVPVPESEAGPESQPNTVGWDDTTPVTEVAPPEPTSHVKRFMLSSNVDVSTVHVIIL
jgi:hypothetical protein